MTRFPARLSGWFSICALLGLALLDSRAASISFTKLNVHVDALPVSGTAYHGYTPHRFEIHNSSSKKRKVTLTLPSNQILKTFPLNASPAPSRLRLVPVLRCCSCNHP